MVVRAREIIAARKALSPVVDKTATTESSGKEATDADNTITETPNTHATTIIEHEQPTTVADPGHTGIDKKEVREANISKEASTTPQENGTRYFQHISVKIKACGHVFGIDCLRIWLIEKRTCPMCRKQLFPRPTVGDCARDLNNRRPVTHDVQEEFAHLPYNDSEMQDYALFKTICGGMMECIRFNLENGARLQREIDLYRDLKEMENHIEVLTTRLRELREANNEAAAFVAAAESLVHLTHGVIAQSVRIYRLLDDSKFADHLEQYHGLIVDMDNDDEYSCELRTDDEEVAGGDNEH